MCNELDKWYKYVKENIGDAQAMYMDVGEKDIVESKVQPSIKVQTLTEAQLRVMEIKMRKLDVATKRRCTFMDKTTLLEKAIHIPNAKRFMWI